MPLKLRLGGKTMALGEGQHDVGRMNDCWLVLDDELVSRYHARFHVRGEALEVEDLGSRNGTFVNGTKLSGRARLREGDEVRIGREIVVVTGSAEAPVEEEDALRRTLAPGEDTKFPSLIGQLVDKSLKTGKLKDAERYAMALASQLATTKVPGSHPAADACVRCFLALAERTAGGVWIDRLFKLHAAQSWVMSESVLDGTRAALDRIPRIPGTGIKEYELRLRQMAKEGVKLPDGLTSTIAELADAYGGG
jgi:hypothetical protein